MLRLSQAEEPVTISTPCARCESDRAVRVHRYKADADGSTGLTPQCPRRSGTVSRRGRPIPAWDRNFRNLLFWLAR